MTFAVGDNCIKCKYTDCVEVCPVDCFYEGPEFLVINPEECIDCALCEPECPAESIFSDVDANSEQSLFLEINRKLSETYTNITQAKDPMPDATQWDGVENKIQYLDLPD